MGDGMNDYDMIEYVGIGVALKNSVQAIKDIAQVYIDKTSEEAAVKEFVEQYILNRKN
ncbi:HAD hydrolase family protein [Vibrio harveyi]|nr:HAD hydrolase family protein [Vibrio harveyi]